MSVQYMPHIVFAGGGTDGQLLPGINVADHVTKLMPEVDITFIGNGRPMQRRMVRSAGYQYVAISAKPTPTNPAEAFRFVAENLAGYWSARWLLRDQKASLVVGLGGLASGASVRAAMARGLPTVLLEPNAVAGRIARWIGRNVSVVCANFDCIREQLPTGSNIQVVGSPVRAEFEPLTERAILRTATLDDQKKRLVILGGNLGAKSLNSAAPAALSRLKEQLHGWSIVHQAGDNELEKTYQRYADAGVEALVVGTLDNPAEVLVESDLVVSRAGATTLAELSVAATPAIVIPFPDAADDHQLANARLYAEGGACRVIDEETVGHRLDAELATHLGSLLADNTTRGEMANAMLQLARPRAADDIAGMICDLTHGRAIAAA